MKTSYSDGAFYKINVRANPFMVSCVSSLTLGIAIDFGCGMGVNAACLKEKGWDVFVVEQERFALFEVEKQLPADRIFQGDITCFDFSNLPLCDLIICNYVLQHLSQDDAKTFINNAFSRLKKDGHVVFSIFERENAIDFAELKKVMYANGFSLLQSKEWSRWDNDHGPAHFHKGVESFWKWDVKIEDSCKAPNKKTDRK